MKMAVFAAHISACVLQAFIAVMLDSQQALACLDFFPHDHLQHAVQGNRHELTTTCLSVCMSGNLCVCLSVCLPAMRICLFAGIML